MPRSSHDCDCIALINRSRFKLHNAKENKTILRSVTHLKDYVIQATDGEIGKVDQFYFDDETWAIRYLDGRPIGLKDLATRQPCGEPRLIDG
jgi:hypothetical protein